MHRIRRWLFVVPFAIAGVWIYVIAGSGAELITLFDAVDDATSAARVVDQAPSVAPAAKAAWGASVAEESLVPRAAEPGNELLLQQASTNDLSGAQILRLLEDEVASDADPAAAEEFLREFGKSLE